MPAPQSVRVVFSKGGQAGGGEAAFRSLNMYLLTYFRFNQPQIMCPYTYCTAEKLADWAPYIWRISWPEKIWQIFYNEILLDFLAYGLEHSVKNILSYLNITNLPRVDRGLGFFSSRPNWDLTPPPPSRPQANVIIDKGQRCNHVTCGCKCYHKGVNCIIVSTK